MKKVADELCSQYVIHHIDLSHSTHFPGHPDYSHGNYVVFWWDTIALGHLYTEPYQSFTQKEFSNWVVEAIEATVQSYAENAQVNQEAWQELMVLGFNNWQRWMVTVFSPFQRNAQITSVPVSVVICTRNRANQLRKCLQSLQYQACAPQEILVVDNAPLDDSTRMVVKEFENVRYIVETKPGLDFARNSGARNAKCPVVAYADDDVEVHPLWAYRVWETFQDPSVFGMTGLVIAKELNTKAQVLFEKKFSFNRGYVDKRYDSAFFKSSLASPDWRLGPGANMAFRKEVFEKVGYFDELLDVGPGAAGCDGDSEMYFRVLNGGYTMCYNPRAISFHKHRKELPELKKQVYDYYRGWSAAALVQQQMNHRANYTRLVFKRYPYHCLLKIIKGFPNYRGWLYETMWIEMKGYLSGLYFYVKNRNRFGNQQRTG
ncbi:MAG: glycosyltransferase [Chitinophagaceae bacterium]|nr:glycosyltransferase [Flavisolibacter longurius]RYY48902.1 MAG: glycosyltransferase [Chitinophagaceae bacterium]